MLQAITEVDADQRHYVRNDFILSDTSLNIGNTK